jgi:hypothetical protein
VSSDKVAASHHRRRVTLPPFPVLPWAMRTKMHSHSPKHPCISSHRRTTRDLTKLAAAVMPLPPSILSL